MIATNLGLVDLEDAQIVKIDRIEDEIRITLENVRIEDSIASKVRLVMNQVSTETAEYFDGHGVRGKNSNPQFPLDTIEIAEFENSTVRLQGYLNNEPWYVWNIITTNVTAEKE